MKLGKYIAGALSGLTFGLLFAPKKGKDLREEIKKKGDKSKHDGLSVLIEAFKEAGVEALDEAKKAADNQTLETAIGNSKEKMKEYFAQIEKTGYDIASRAKEKLEELHDMASDTTDNLKKTARKKAARAKKAVVSRVKKVTKEAKKQVKKVKKEVSKASKPKGKTKLVAQAKVVRKSK